MKKINYIETEEGIGGHGFLFHYMPLSYDDLEERPKQKPVAILLLDGWYNNKPQPIYVRIRPISSPILEGMDEKPELIIAEVKEAIELFLNTFRHISMPKDKITDHVWTYVNA